MNQLMLHIKRVVKDKKRYAGGRRLGYVSGIEANGQKQLFINSEEAKIVRLIYAKYLGEKGIGRLPIF